MAVGEEDPSRARGVHRVHPKKKLGVALSPGVVAELDRLAEFHRPLRASRSELVEVALRDFLKMRTREEVESLLRQRRGGA